MAMDDTYRLVHGVLIDGMIAQPAEVVELFPKGPWKTARVLDASVSYLGGGRYNGYVRYVIEGEDRARMETFYRLWMEGWTSYTFMQEVIAANRKPRKGAVTVAKARKLFAKKSSHARRR